MYYYIFESKSTNSRISDLEDKIRQYLSELGIAGEITSPSHARTIDFLVDQAFEKQYSTIVAVGGIQHITSIAKKIAGTNYVLGVIPIDPLKEISNFLNIKNWKEGANALKARRYIEISLGVIDPGLHIFITSCKISSNLKNQATIIFPNFQAKNINGPINIKLNTDGSKLIFNLISEEKSSIFSFFSINKNSDKLESIFIQKRGQIITEKSTSVIVDQTEICQTPITVSMHNKKLKIIIARLHKIEE